MPAAIDSKTERRRLEALRHLNILDSEAETFSEAVVSAAAAIMNTPMSAISLVDANRQWFKASCGLGVSETPRDVSFCAHAIQGTAPLVVPDALQDPRFRDNPLVQGAPYIRFYAGFPLVVGGQAIGALCVIDDRARQPSQEQLKKLEQLSDGAAAWLASRSDAAR